MCARPSSSCACRGATGQAANAVPPKTAPRKAVWFYSLELAQLAEGAYHLSVAATTVDEEEPQLLYQDILHERIALIDDALAKLRRVLTAAN
jgi:hypothetical protein